MLSYYSDIWDPGKVFKREKGKCRDNVDTKYQDVYRKWTGLHYKNRHPSTIPTTCKNVISPLQPCPGYCVICPLQKQIYSAYDLKRHYKHMHHNCSWVVWGYTLLRCKCSEIKSQGKDKYSRNTHYHCHLCQWLKKDREQLAIHYASKHSFPFEDIRHLCRHPENVRSLFLAKEDARKKKKDSKSKGDKED